MRLTCGCLAVAGAPLTPAAFADGGAPQLKWTASRDVAGDSDGGLLVAAGNGGSVFVVGATPLFLGGENMIVLKYDADGLEQWMTTFAGDESGGFALPADALVGPDGDLYVTGQAVAADEALSPEWVTLRFAAADGSLLWERRFHGTGTWGWAIPRDMAIGPDGRIAVAGWARDDESFGDFGVVVYDPDGTELWNRLFTSPGFESDVAEAVAVGDDGSVVVAGTYVEADDRVVGTVKYDAAGELQWWATFDASAFVGLEDWVQSVAVDATGNAYVAASGLDNFEDSRDFVLLKYGPDGELLWDRRVINPTADTYPVVLLGPEGNVYLSGPISNVAHRLAAFSAAGEQLWTVTHAGGILDQARRNHALIDAQGHVAVMLRQVVTPGIAAFTIVRYGSDGVIVDETVIDPEGMTRSPTALCTDEQGNLYATGWWLPAGNRDVLTYRLSPGMPGDLDGDGLVGTADLLALLSGWGTCPGPPEPCAADLDGDGSVGTTDLLVLLANWG